MTNQSPLVKYSKKGPPYVKTGGRHHDDFARDPAVFDSSIASERCAVRGCANTFTSQPPKIFVPFPVQHSKRSMWLKAVGFDPEHPPSFKLYCCEDHFDLKRDVMCLSTLRTVNSGVIPDLLKDGVIPHRRTTPVGSQDDPFAKDSPKEEKVLVTRGSQLPEPYPQSSSSKRSSIREPRIRLRSPQELIISSTTPLTEPSNACTWPPGGGERTTFTHERVIPTSVIQKNPHLPRTTMLGNILMSNGRAKPDGGSAGYVSQTGRPVTQSQSVPDLNRHSPVLMSEAINNIALGCKSEVEDDPNNVASSLKPIRDHSRNQKYRAVTMPQYPDCKHKGQEYYCWTLTVEDCTSFHTRFYNLDTRDQQDEFIYSHTATVLSSSPDLNQPAFKFFIDRNNSLGTNKRVLVCAHAFSTCLSFEVTALISLVTRHFETFLPKEDSQPNLVLKPTKAGTDGDDDDDVMIYESIPQIVEIEDSTDEEMPILAEANGSGRCNGRNFDTPLTVKEELLQTDQQISDNEIVAGDETNTFETVHICRRCLAQFKSKAAFFEHENQISPCRQFNGDVFKCSTCGISLTTYQSLKVHTTVIHKYVCPKCGDTFRYRRYLEDHMVKCSGTNQLSDGMRRLVDRTNVMQHRTTDAHEKTSMASQPVISNIPSSKCIVVLEKLKTPTGIERSFSLSELTEIVEGQPGDLPRLKIRTVSNNAAISQMSNASSPGDMEEDSQDAEQEEEVDVESTVVTSEPHERTKGPAISSKKQSKRKLSKYRGERGSSRNMSAEKQNWTATRELRARKPVSLAESDIESENSEQDPDFVPVELERQMNKNKSENNSEESDIESENSELDDPDFVPDEFEPQMKKNKSENNSEARCAEETIECSRCNIGFFKVDELLAHLRLSEECRQFFRGSVFKRDGHKRKFANTRAKSTPTTVDVDLLICVNCNKPFSSLYNLRFHLKSPRQCLASARVGSEASEVSSLDDTASKANSDVSEKRPQSSIKGPHTCKGCNVFFNSVLGLGLHLKRSTKCIPDNPDIDIPGVVDKSAFVNNSSAHANQEVKGLLMRGVQRTVLRAPDQDVVYPCAACHSSFSSIWGLRTHERKSVNCKPDRPYEIFLPIPKHEAEKQREEYLAKCHKESNRPPAPSSSKGTVIVYTQELKDEDGKFKCNLCSAVFTSIFGLRSHQRISATCMDKNALRLPRPYQKDKITLSEAAAISIARGENICPNCSAKFSTSWGLRTHLRTSKMCSGSETDIKPENSQKLDEDLRCPKCNELVLNLKDLRDHVKNKPSCLPEDATISPNGLVQPGAGCFPCPRCRMTFKIPFSLDHHFLDHAPHKEDWICQLCTKEFPNQFALHRHFHREHIGKWLCIMCEKNSVLDTFKDFYVHICDQHATGTEKASFKCSICYKSFISKFSHDFHVISCRKLTERIFQCASCHKAFNKKVHITSHMKYAHSGVTIDKRYKYKCPDCPRTFLSKKDCKQKHPKGSCIQEKIPCEICGEMYAGFDKLKIHLNIAHKQRSKLHTGRISPKPGRKSPHPENGTPETSRPRSEPAEDKPIDLTSPSVSPIPPFSADIQESPTSPD